MYKLVILCRFERLSKMPDKEQTLEEFPTQGHAELRALRWLMYRPYDIVMIMRTKCHADGEAHCCCDQLEDCNLLELV